MQAIERQDAELPTSPADRTRWTTLIEVVGALAGVAVVVYSVGALLLAVRLWALALPLEATLGVLPNQSFAVAGGRALLPGLAALALLLFILRWSTGASGNDGPQLIRPVIGRRAVGALVFVVLLVVVPVMLAVLQPQSTLTFALNGVLAIIGAAIAVLLSRMGRSRVRAYGLLSLVLVLGTALQLVDAAAPPIRLDFASVRMKAGDVTDGYFLGANGDTVYLAPNVADRVVGTVTALPRDDVASMSLYRGRHAVSKLGGPINQKLVGAGTGASRDQQAEQDDLYGFLAHVRTDPGWIHPPPVASRAVGFLRHHYGEFTQVRRRRWQRGHPRVEVRDLVVDPELFTGDDPADYRDVRSFASAQVAPYAIRGRLVETVVINRVPEDRSDYRLFVIASGAAARSEAYCGVTVSARRRFRVGQTVELLGIAVGWGLFNARASQPVEEVALVCSAVRSAPRSLG
jgi:hypothetical protein